MVYLCDQAVEAEVTLAHPSSACDLDETPTPPNRFANKIVLVRRGECMFIEKARVLEKWGALAGIITGYSI